MLENYYRDQLYPLQDSFLKLLARIPSPFYLTGGTALSREYLHHRYSDDLDFFCNDIPSFAEAVEQVLQLVRSEYKNVTVGTTTASFVRFFIFDGDVELKVDLVNDVPYHSGEIVTGKLFPYIDNPLNILSNKIAALTRREAKDFADILWIARNFAFDWVNIIEDAKQKDLWVDELDVAELLSSFPVDTFENIRWTTRPDLKLCAQDLNQIATDIASDSKNSLYPGSRK
jgi:hypothetical protein